MKLTPKLGLRPLWTLFGTLMLSAVVVSNADASRFVGQAAGNDAESVNALIADGTIVGVDPFDQATDTTSIDGDHVDEFGPKLMFYTVHDADAADPDGDGNIYDSDDQIVQWWLEEVPIGMSLEEPFFISIKVGGQDNFIYEFSVPDGDMFVNPSVNGGAGFVDYHSMVYDLRTNPVDGSVLTQGISHVGVVGRMVPEPSALAISVLLLFLAVISCRLRLLKP